MADFEQAAGSDPVKNAQTGLFSAVVIVASLGYFVDIYDLLLFSIVRVPSLVSLGFAGQQITDNGVFLLNVQMIGMLAGGIFWGILGDKKGRLSVLFGSILLYSAANIANGFVHSLEMYALWRFVAGFGLAGELGAGITLVSEVMPRNRRGYATTMVASVGISGAVVAFFVARLFEWRTSFFIGGALGFLLLILRVSVVESGMFSKTRATSAVRGNFLYLFTNGKRLLKYLQCIVIGMPLWFVVGILITLSPEFGKVLGVQGDVNAGAAVACCYGGLVLGDIVSGMLSQYLKSRIRVVYIFLFLAIAAMAAYFLVRGSSLTLFYTICFIVGLCVGYWVIFMTIAAEQFGTNIRATVTTTVPNFVRGAVVPMTLLFSFLKGALGGDIVLAAIIVGGIVLALCFWALGSMQETFSKDLDYVEE